MSKPKEYYPKRKNIFVVDLPEKFGIQNWTVQKCNKPVYSLEGGGWENIKIEFIDPVKPSTSEGLFKIFKSLQDEEVSDSIFSFSIKTLDPVGAEIEEWVINVKNVLKIYFGDLDYDSDEAQTPYLIVEPLTCELKTNKKTVMVNTN